jgi:hypothetical protein
MIARRTKIAGQTWGRDKPLFYVDSIAEHSYRPIPGDFGLGNGDEGAKWIDNHRLLLGTGLRIVVFDLQTNRAHDLGLLDLAFPSQNGRWLTTRLKHTEGDVWELTLGDAR